MYGHLKFYKVSVPKLNESYRQVSCSQIVIFIYANQTKNYVAWNYEENSDYTCMQIYLSTSVVLNKTTIHFRQNVIVRYISQTVTLYFW